MQAVTQPDPTGGILMFIIYATIVIGLFLLLRSIVLWYFKINKHIELLEDIKAYTMLQANFQDPEKFHRFDQLWNQYKKSMAGKMTDPRKSELGNK
jgi:hypothetical protein